MSITFWGKLFSNIGIMTRTMNWKRSVSPRLLFATLLRKKPFSPSVKSYGSKRNSSWQKTVNSEANACSAWRHVFVANFTVRLRLNVFKDTLFYLCLSKTIFNTCVTVLESLNLMWSLCTEIFLKDLSKSVNFPYARGKHATDQSTP